MDFLMSNVTMQNAVSTNQLTANAKRRKAPRPVVGLTVSLECGFRTPSDLFIGFDFDFYRCPVPDEFH